MPRAIINLQDPTDLRTVQGQWRFAPGFIPGEPNEGLISQAVGSPARLPGYNDTHWEVRPDLTVGHSRGFTFVWYRLTATLPERASIELHDRDAGRSAIENQNEAVRGM